MFISYERKRTETDMTRFIEFTTVYANRTQVDVMQYGEAEMAEVFAPHERLWLEQGKIVEREDGKTTVVDLQAFFKARSN